MSSDEEAPPQRQRAITAAQTREQLLHAALRVFALHGYEAVGLREIAEAAGMTHGLVRHHFGSKEGVWRAAVDLAVTRYETVLFDDAHAEGDVLVQARDTIRRFLLLSAQRPALMQLLLLEGIKGGERMKYVLNKFLPLGERLVPLFEQLQAAGYLHRFDNRTLFLVLLLGGAGPYALAPLTAWLVGPEAVTSQGIEQHIERYLDTLLTRAPDALPA